MQITIPTPKYETYSGGQAREHLIGQTLFAHGSLAKEESEVQYWPRP